MGIIILLVCIYSHSHPMNVCSFTLHIAVACALVWAAPVPRFREPTAMFYPFPRGGKAVPPAVPTPPPSSARVGVWAPATWYSHHAPYGNVPVTPAAPAAYDATCRAHGPCGALPAMATQHYDMYSGNTYRAHRAPHPPFDAQQVTHARHAYEPPHDTRQEPVQVPTQDAGVGSSYPTFAHDSAELDESVELSDELIAMFGAMEARRAAKGARKGHPARGGARSSATTKSTMLPAQEDAASRTVQHERRREREHKERLYGVHVKEVRALEAAVNQAFDSETRARKPVMWPTVPLRE